MTPATTADAFTPLERNAVSIAGRPDGRPTVVFVHGFGSDQTVWHPVSAAFGDCRVVLLDNAGAGRSPAGAFVQHRYLGLERYASDLAAVLDALDARPAVLVGHSAGGMIAALVAAERPELVSRLVLIGASPRYRNTADYHGGFTEDDVRDVYRAVAANYEEWADHFARTMMGAPDQPHLARSFADCLRSIPADRALTVLCSIFQCDHRDALAQIACPTLIVQSRDDAAVPPEVVEYMNRTIAESQVAKVDSSGHLPHVAAPALVVAAIAEFVRGAGSRPS
jgi:sigma-B regulation protein RsbQ